MNTRNCRRSLFLLILASGLAPVLGLADVEFTGVGMTGQWTPIPPHEPVAKSIEHPAASYYESRLTPPERPRSAQLGYQIMVQVTFDETGAATDAKIHASDDNTPGGMLNQVALQLARNVRQPPRLKDGQPVGFTARVPFFFPVEGDEGPEANQAPQPKLLRSQPPQYPDLLATKGESGGAILELAISETGAVTKVRVLSASHEVCGDAAVAAVKNWTFEPAEKNGRPVSSRWRIAVAFESAGRPAELKWRLAPRPNLGAYTVTATP